MSGLASGMTQVMCGSWTCLGSEVSPQGTPPPSHTVGQRPTPLFSLGLSSICPRQFCHKPARAAESLWCQ